ncbi:MAG: BrnA antitoxin family protein [Acidiferrobacter sp.]
MRDEYDFSKGKRGAVLPATGKTRITIYIDDEILAAFQTRAEEMGSGYQTLMNEALKASLAKDDKPLTAAALRRILREEMTARSGR